MSRESFRVAFTALVEARKSSWSGYTLLIEYDNRLVVNTQTQTNPFLCVKILYVSGDQATLGTYPIQRDYGQIHLAAVVKENSGVAQANALLDFFVPSLRLRTADGTRLYASRPQKEQVFKGWVYFPVLIPFQSDTFT